MEIMDNQKINISNALLIEYYKNLIGNIYKILPIMEGKATNKKDIEYTPEIAYRNFQTYTSNLLVEMHGNISLFYSVNSIRIIVILRGILNEIKIDDHKKLKSCVFQCIDLCQKIIGELESDKE
jgi:hypothetical protein